MSKKDSLHQPGGHIEEVPGVTVDWRWSGISRTGNRRSIPPNYFWTANNVRIEDDDVSGRKGLAKVNSGDSSDTSCTIGITDLPGLPTAGRIFTLQGDIVSAAKGYGHVYVPSLDETTLNNLNPSGGILANGSEFLIKYEGNIYNDKGYLIRLVEEAGTFRAGSGEQKIYPDPDPASQMVVGPTIETNADILKARGYPNKDLFDVYFISSGLPYRWDGNQSYAIGTASDFSSLTLEHIGYLNEKLFVVVDGATEGTAGLFYRDFDGTWTSVNVPTLTLPGDVSGDEFAPKGITIFGEEALIHGYSTGAGGLSTWYGTILVWNGSTYTVGTQTGRVGSSEVAPGGIFDATVRGNRYFYTYTIDSVGGFAPYIGRYTGAAWNDTYLDATTFLNTGYAPGGISSKGTTVFVTSHDFVNESGNTEAWYTTAANLSSWTQVTVEDAATPGTIPFPHRAFTL